MLTNWLIWLARVFARNHSKNCPIAFTFCKQRMSSFFGSAEILFFLEESKHRRRCWLVFNPELLISYVAIFLILPFIPTRDNLV